MGKVTPADVEALVQIFDASDWDELQLEMEGFELFLSKDPQGRPQSSASVAAPVAGESRQPTATASAAMLPAKATAAVAVPAGWVAVRAPNLGTFYRAPKPGAAPYVETGQEVTPETELCLLEVMKLFTAVRAGSHGVIREICVADAEMVEFDQPLFLIEPQQK